MGVLKSLTDEYFGNNIRTEDLIDISDLDVEIVSFTDGKGNHHGHGYRVKDGDENEMAKTLKTLIERAIEKRGNECDLNDIDVSNIKQMYYMNDWVHIGVFEKSNFNGDISGWNVSGVRDMSFMFYCAIEFNQPIGNWDVSGVNNMGRMFWCAKKFNQPIGNWDVRNVEDMNYMFCDAENFNQPLKDWGDKLGKVKNMSNMFYFAKNFNQPIGNWDVSGVEDMSHMFCDAESFKQDLSGWELKDDCETEGMFDGCPIDERNKPKNLKK